MKEKKKKRKKVKLNLNNDKIFKGLVILLAITTVILIIVFITGRKPKNDDPLINELYNYFSTDDLTNCEGLFNYASAKVDYNTINKETRLCIAYQKANIKNAEIETLSASKNSDTCKKGNMVFKVQESTEKCEITKIDKSIIDNSYLKIFGKEIEENEKFEIDGTHTCYLNEDYYYCGLSETYTFILGGSKVSRAIKNYKEKGSEITIYDYFIKLNEPICYANYTSDIINQKCTNKYKPNKKINFSFLKKYGSKYKHTYQKAEDGTYYWVSSEPVK